MNVFSISQIAEEILSRELAYFSSTLQEPVAIIGQHGGIQEGYHPLSPRVKAKWSLTTVCSEKTTFESHAAAGQM